MASPQPLNGLSFLLRYISGLFSAFLVWAIAVNFGLDRMSYLGPQFIAGWLSFGALCLMGLVVFFVALRQISQPSRDKELTNRSATKGVIESMREGIFRSALLFLLVCCPTAFLAWQLLGVVAQQLPGSSYLTRISITDVSSETSGRALCKRDLRFVLERRSRKLCIKTQYSALPYPVDIHPGMNYRLRLRKTPIGLVVEGIFDSD